MGCLIRIHIESTSERTGIPEPSTPSGPNAIRMSAGFPLVSIPSSDANSSDWNLKQKMMKMMERGAWLITSDRNHIHNRDTHTHTHTHTEAKAEGNMNI